MIDSVTFVLSRTTVFCILSLLEPDHSSETIRLQTMKFSFIFLFTCPAFRAIRQSRHYQCFVHMHLCLYGDVFRLYNVEEDTA